MNYRFQWMTIKNIREIYESGQLVSPEIWQMIVSIGNKSIDTLGVSNPLT